MSLPIILNQDFHEMRIETIPQEQQYLCFLAPDKILLMSQLCLPVGEKKPLESKIKELLG